MNRKIISALLCLCLVLAIVFCATACDGDNGKKDEKTEAPTQEPTETPTSEPTEAPTTPKENPTEPPEPTVSHKISVIDINDDTGIAGVTVEIWNQADTALVASAVTNEEGVSEFSIDYKTYIIKLKNVPEGYHNVDTYLISKSVKEYAIRLLDYSEIVLDGSDEDHRLLVYNGDNVTVAAGATLYCSSPRTPGYVMTITDATGLKVVYKGIEYLAENGIIRVEFDEQAHDETNAIPNDFEIVNTTDAEIFAPVRTASTDEGQTKDNPYTLTTGTITTPVFTDSISAYYYEFIAMVKGTVVITSTDAKISIYTSESDEAIEGNSILLSSGESILVKVENINGTDAVTFTVEFE